MLEEVVEAFRPIASAYASKRRQQHPRSIFSLPSSSSSSDEQRTLSSELVRRQGITDKTNEENGHGLVFVDATFGRGGHTTAILERLEGSNVIAVDRDNAAIESDECVALQKRFGRRLRTARGRFGELSTIVRKMVGPAGKVDGILFDLGVSSPQLDVAERGFSFRPDHDGPLDMRMDQSGNTLTAEEIVNTFSETDLADAIFKNGEERHSRQIARGIVLARQKTRISRTSQLADVVRGTIQRIERRSSKQHSGQSIDPATRTFQALRILVNDEINELRRGLAHAEELLAPLGRLAVISFHSLEDREVKDFLQYCSGKRRTAPFDSLETAALIADKDDGTTLQQHGTSRPSFTVSSRLIVASDAETSTNPRARSAKLRVATRTTAEPRMRWFLDRNSSQ